MLHFQDSSEADNIPHLSSKRQSLDQRTREAQHAARDRFWDTLSKVWLTPRALDEFDRRNPLGQTRTADLGGGLWPYKRLPLDTSQLTAASLKNLKRFARRGGPSLTDLRNCPESPAPFSKAMTRGRKRSPESANTSNRSTNDSVQKSSAYDRNFEQKCIDHGIHMPSRRDKPKNWQELQESLAENRRSLSPSQFSDREFERFCESEEEARNEDDVVSGPLLTILGKKRRDYPLGRTVLFGNMDDMVPDIFKKPIPDRYWGARPTQIDPRVRQDLNHQIVPSTNDSRPVAPNMFLEAKGHDGPAAVKTRQACYIGAMGARGMHALQCYGQAKLTYDNNAYTYSSTYENGTLKIYAHHPTQPSHPGEPAEYRMTQIGAWALTGSPETFRQGVSALRTIRDLAKEQQDTLIAQANAVARGGRTLSRA